MIRPIAKPDIDVGAHFVNCARGTQDAQRRQQLINCIPLIEQAATRYEQAAVEGRLFEVEPEDCAPLEPEYLGGLYERAMARGGARGRDTYNQIRLAAPNNRCPLCGQRDVGTLDHFLPISEFPELGVTPINLIPACSRCNWAKSAFRPDSYENQLIHPYYDDVTEYRWLNADVHENAAGLVLRYFVNSPPEWPGAFVERIKHHFDYFELGELYATHAAEQLLNIASRIHRLHEAGGNLAVREHLREEADSHGVANLNSWQTAMFEALASNDNYCDRRI